MRILIVRSDRLGDALLALPCTLFLRKSLPEADIDFLCSSVAKPAVKPWLLSHRINCVTHVVPGELRGVYDAILFLHLDSALLLNAWKEWVRLRVGVYSKPLSYFFLNAGLLQHRSRGALNEGQYNVDLAAHLLRKLGLVDVGSQKWDEKIVLPINRWESEKVLTVLRKAGIVENFHVVHPGTGGSALNHTIDGYEKLIASLFKEGIRVIVSQGPAPMDATYANELKRRLPSLVVMQELSLTETMELFRMAETVTAPSTGPLHLAHYVGTTCIGIYSPLKSQHWKRWAPWGGAGAVRVCSPDVKCPAHSRCRGVKCREYFCLDQLSPHRLILAPSFV